MEGIRRTYMWKSSQGIEFNKLIHHAHADKREKLILALRRDPHLAFINRKRKPIAIQSAQHVSEAKQIKGQTLFALGLARWGPF